MIEHKDRSAAMSPALLDRRALLVSALAYVLFALTELFRTFGAVELNVALTAFLFSFLYFIPAIWYLYRMIKGVIYLNDRRPMPV